MRIKNPLFYLLLIIVSLDLYAQVSDYSEQPITLPEVWRIENRSYQIPQTVITGNALYTVHTVVDFRPQNDAKSVQIARRIARYAIVNGYMGNALKYNRYSANYYINSEIIGITLIHIDDPATRKITGYRFTFTLEELFGSDFQAANMAAPEVFDDKARQKLIQELETIIKSRKFDDVLNLYEKTALEKLNLEEAKNRLRVSWSLAKDIKITNDGFLIYEGRQNNTLIYGYYLPVEIIPAAAEKIKLYAYIKVKLHTEKDSFAIRTIDLNFPDQKSLGIYFGKGEGVEFPVLKD